MIDEFPKIQSKIVKDLGLKEFLKRLNTSTYLFLFILFVQCTRYFSCDAKALSLHSKLAVKLIKNIPNRLFSWKLIIVISAVLLFVLIPDIFFRLPDRFSDSKICERINQKINNIKIDKQGYSYLFVKANSEDYKLFLKKICKLFVRLILLFIAIYLFAMQVYMPKTHWHFWHWFIYCVLVAYTLSNICQVTFRLKGYVLQNKLLFWKSNYDLFDYFSGIQQRDSNDFHGKYWLLSKARGEKVWYIIFVEDNIKDDQ